MRSATTHAARGHRKASGPDALRTAAAVVAATFLTVGIAGFVPGLTTNVGDMQFAGTADQMSEQPELLGVFHVSVLHNLVHLAFGAVGLALCRTARGAAAFLVGGGIAYAAVLVYGLLADEHADANFLPVNAADNWLHGILALGMVLLGIALTGPSRKAVEQGAGAPAS